MSKVLILNGCSSAGKTSLVKAIQHLSEEPWLTFGIDSVIDAMPGKLVGSGKGAAEGFHFVSDFEKGFPITKVKIGSIGEKVSNLAPEIVKLLADNGFNIAVDEVI
jgi:chloramphenicol 3-O phosphotransferase